MAEQQGGRSAPLDEYRRKRDFERTPEPLPEELDEAAGAPSFVVQKHAARRMHYDFRLEHGSVLKSWAVPKGPSYDPAVKRLAVMTEDHPLSYAGFEGVIPRGQYGGGQVIVWDRGTYRPLDTSGAAVRERAAAERLVREGLAGGRLRFALRGHKLRGAWDLIRTAARPNQWLLIKRPDEHTDVGRDVTQEDRSVLSDRRVEDVASVPRPLHKGAG